MKSKRPSIVKMNEDDGPNPNELRRQALIVNIPSPPTIIPFKDNDSEAVAAFMITKIISMVSTSVLTKKIERALEDICYQYTNKVVSSFLKSQYISHDTEEKGLSISQNTSVLPRFAVEEIKKNNNPSQKNLLNDDIDFDFNKKFYYNNFCRGENSWDVPSEPPHCEPDNYAGNFVEIEKKHPEKKNAIGIPVISELNELNEKTPRVESNPSERTGRNASKTRQSVTTLSPKSTKGEEKEKPKKVKISPQEMLEQLSFQDYESKENTKVIDESMEKLMETLRKEKENEFLKIEQEKVNKKKQEKIQKIAKEEENKKANQYKGKHITTDVMGNVVFIKGINPDNFKTDFLQSQSGFKTKAPPSPGTKKRKSVQTRPSVLDELSNLKINESSISKITGIKDISLSRESIKNNLPRISKVGLPGKRKSINSPDDKLKHLIPVIPCGSCFDTINLEVGVTMKENEKLKSGGRDFFKKYQKLSTEIYNKQLTDTLRLNNTNYANLFRSQNVSAKMDYPCLTNTFSNENIKGNQTSSSNLFSGSLLSPLSTTHRNSLLLSPVAQSEKPFKKTTLKINSDMLSFKTALESDFLTESSNNRNEAPKNKNIFKGLKPIKKALLTSATLEDINQFNKTVLSNDWKNVPKYAQYPPTAPKIKSPLKNLTNFRVRHFRGVSNGLQTANTVVNTVNTVLTTPKKVKNVL